MRRVLIAAIVLVVALSCATTARPAATFVIKGKGWGHGLGLAQYGAHGYARDGGRDYRWILDHYYTGTTLGAAGVGRVRVLVASGVGRVTVGSAAAFRVPRDVFGNLRRRPALPPRQAAGRDREREAPTQAGPLRLAGHGAAAALRGGYRGRIACSGRAGS